MKFVGTGRGHVLLPQYWKQYFQNFRMLVKNDLCLFDMKLTCRVLERRVFSLFHYVRQVVYFNRPSLRHPKLFQKVFRSSSCDCCSF